MEWKKYKKTKIIIFILFLAFISYIVYFMFSSQDKIFSFEIYETGEQINGEVLINNISIGYTNNGTIIIPELNNTPKEFIFRGNYNGEDFEFPFEFPQDLEEYSEFPFAINEKSIGDDFYYIEDVHWTHMPITYYITNERECGKYETYAIKWATDLITNSTEGIVKFEKINKSADINFKCSYLEDCYKEVVGGGKYWITTTTTICAYDSGYAEITNYDGNKILNAEIELVGLAGFAETSAGNRVSGFKIGDSGYPTTELHEILHTFGYTHIDNPNSIMNEYKEEVISSVDLGIFGVVDVIDVVPNSLKNIDKEIAEDLIWTYG